MQEPQTPRTRMSRMTRWELTVLEFQSRKSPPWAECPPLGWPWPASSLKGEKGLFYGVTPHRRHRAFCRSALTSYVLQNPPQSTIDRHAPSPFRHLLRVFKAPFVSPRAPPRGLVGYSSALFSSRAMLIWSRAREATGDIIASLEKRSLAGSILIIDESGFPMLSCPLNCARGARWKLQSNRVLISAMSRLKETPFPPPWGDCRNNNLALRRLSRLVISVVGPLINERRRC